MRDVLRELGFNEITQIGTFDAVQEAIGAGEYDLLILGEVIEGRSSLPLIRSLRTGELGPHPFPLVLLMLQPGATTDMIREAINVGPDDVLIMPFANADFKQRIARMAEGRKPFIVSYQYIGPDRRKQDRIDASPTPVLMAPNPIVIKGRGEDYSAALKQATDSYHGRLSDTGNRMILSLLQEGASLCRVTQPDLAHIERVAVQVVEVGMKLNERVVGQIGDRVRSGIQSFVNAMGALRSANHTQRERVAALGQLFQGCLDTLVPARLEVDER